MQKTLEGKIVSLKMQETAVVVVERKTAHPLYRKLLKRSKKYKVGLNNHTVTVGDRVKIGEVRRISKDKYFQIVEVLK